MSSIVKKRLKDVGLDFGAEVPKNPAPFQFKEENKEQRLEQEKRQKRLLTEARDKKSRQSSDIKKSFELNNKVQQLLKDVGVERATKTSIQIDEDFEEDVLEKEQVLSAKERHEFELKMIAEKATKMRETEEEEKRLNEVSEHAEISRSEQIQNKLSNPFTLGREVDSTIWREAAINELSKTYVPEAITSYPEPFEEEPALNRELSEFKRKINEHMRKMGFAGGAGGGAGIVGDLDDVDISNRGHKTILMYNDVTKKYEFTDPDLDAGISHEDDSGDEIILDGTTSGGADEGGSIQQEDNTRMAGGSTAVTAINNATANEIVTIGSTTTELDAEANLTFDGSTLAVSGAITGTTDLTLGDDLILDSDGAIIQFGDDQEIKLTHVADTGLSITSTAATPLVRRGEDVFMVLNGTDSSSTDAGDNIIDETDSDDIIGEDEVFLHTGMQRDVINIVGSDGKIKKSIAGFSSGAI